MSRYAVYALSLLLTAISTWLALLGHAEWRWGVVGFGALALLGTVDLLQQRSTLRRHYPILAHFRYGLESIGPEMRQYFIEADTAETPFSRQQRALVYQRSKSVNDTRPFGTLQDVYGIDYEWINHSLAPSHVESSDFRVVVGNGCAHATGQAFTAMHQHRSVPLGARSSARSNISGVKAVMPPRLPCCWSRQPAKRFTISWRYRRRKRPPNAQSPQK